MFFNNMRIWDIHPKYLCRKHLLAEHRELHGLWNILTRHKNKGGYSNHPETLRWKGKRRALYQRHEILLKELLARRYNHFSFLDKKYADGQKDQKAFLNTIKDQKKILKNKPCGCLR